MPFQTFDYRTIWTYAGNISMSGPGDTFPLGQGGAIGSNVDQLAITNSDVLAHGVYAYVQGTDPWKRVAAAMVPARAGYDGNPTFDLLAAGTTSGKALMRIGPAENFGFGQDDATGIGQTIGAIASGGDF